MKIVATINLPDQLTVAEAEEFVRDLVAVAKAAIPVNAQHDSVVIESIKGEFNA